MSAEWYYARAGKQTGPVSAADLSSLAASGQLSPVDMVWKEGMQTWVPAERIKGLFAAMPAMPVPPSLPPVRPAGRTAGASSTEGVTVTKIISPSAFALALLLFCLPWITVSCRNKNTGGDIIKVLSQSGLQTCYAGASSEQPDSNRKKKSHDAGIKDPAPALLMVLYGAAVAAGLALSVAVAMGNERLRKWMIAGSAVAFCSLTLQLMLGFPIEGWLYEDLPKQAWQQRNSMSHDDQMGMAMAVGAIESGSLTVRYTPFLWLSLLVALTPAVVVVGEEWFLCSSSLGRSLPQTASAFTQQRL